MRHCPYCGTGGHLYQTTSSASFIRCSRCDLIYRERPASRDAVTQHYRNDYFERYHDDALNRQRGRLFARILDSLERSCRTGSLLDVGTGSGVFLREASRRGWGVRGIEPSRQSVALARRRYGLDIFHGTLKDYTGIVDFDVATFINVLDHAVEPWMEIERGIRLLKPGGLLFLRFPHARFHFSLYKAAQRLNLHRFIAPLLVFHEYSFTPEFITTVLSHQGCTDIVAGNAPLSGESLRRRSPLYSAVVVLMGGFERATRMLFGQRFLWGPSLEVTARKGDTA